MAEVIATTASAAVASGTVAAISGLPPQDVILWSLVGGLVSVWMDKKDSEVCITARWIGSVMLQMCVSTAAGIALSAAVLSIAPAYEVSRPLAAVPRWVLGVVIAALIHKGAPLAWAGLKRLSIGGKQGSEHAE